MEKIGSREDHNANAWGRPTNTRRTTYRIDEGDIGKELRNYRGYGHSTLTLTRQDIGRQIEVITCPGDPNYTCWTFTSDNKA